MPNPKANAGKRAARTPIISRSFPSGKELQSVLHNSGATRLCSLWSEGWTLAKKVRIGRRTYVPYPASNNLIRHRVLLLPGEPVEYQSVAELVGDIRSFIHRYVDLSLSFEEIATHYVLLTWVYDSFAELPYLRFRGDYGSGKTRALLTIGSLCYKPIFASGASTTSPLFRMLDEIQGTLIVDEADFRFSDEKAEIIKILNNGNARGFPILRSEGNGKGEFNPRAFSVYGPKLVASRKVFDDQALESRCITEELGTKKLREDIPINLPEALYSEAQELRSKLLLYRFRNRDTKWNRSVPDAFEPRMKQVFNPLYSVMESESSRKALESFLERHQRKLGIERGSSVDAQVLSVIHALLEQADIQVGVREVTDLFADRHATEYGHAITPRWIGHIVRNSLSLETKKSNGRYVIPRSERPKLTWLFDKYGLTD